MTRQKDKDFAADTNEARRKQFLAAVKLARVRPGSWLRQWRADHAITQVELAEILNVSSRTLIRAEQADELPRVIVLALEGK